MMPRALVPLSPLLPLDPHDRVTIGSGRVVYRVVGGGSHTLTTVCRESGKLWKTVQRERLNRVEAVQR